MHEIYDVVIIGAGPGGATLARLLNKKYQVMLVDKRNLNSINHHKRKICCGGLLAPAAQKVLAKQGLALPKDILVGTQMLGVKAIDQDYSIEKYYQRHYMNMDREKFDRWLISLLPSKIVTEFDAIYRNHKEVNDCIEVTLIKNQKRYRVKTRILVGADGAMSRIREELFKGQDFPEKYVSIQRWYKSDKKIPYYVSLFDQHITDFYSWIIQKDGQIVIGSAMKKENHLVKKFDKLIERLKDEGYDLSEEQRREGSLIMRTRRLKQVHLFQGQVALIGEAAGLISPSSAEGMSYALESGAFLAEALNNKDENFGYIYSKKVNKLKRNIFIKNIKVRLMYTKWSRWLIMKSGIFSMQVKTEDCIIKCTLDKKKIDTRKNQLYNV